MGIIYWLFAIGISLRPQWDAYIITYLVFAAALIGYTKYQEKSGNAALYISGAVHALLHTVAVIWLTSESGSPTSASSPATSVRKMAFSASNASASAPATVSALML